VPVVATRTGARTTTESLKLTGLPLVTRLPASSVVRSGPMKLNPASSVPVSVPLMMMWPPSAGAWKVVGSAKVASPMVIV
jgi:hypothetical protein